MRPPIATESAAAVALDRRWRTSRPTRGRRSQTPQSRQWYAFSGGDHARHAPAHLLKRACRVAVRVAVVLFVRIDGVAVGVRGRDHAIAVSAARDLTIRLMLLASGS